MRRLVVVHYTSPPDVGGCEIAAAEMAVAASERPGWSATLVTGTATPAVLTDSDVKTITLPEIGTRHPLSQANYRDFCSGRSPAHLRALARTIRTQLDTLLAPGDILLSINAFSLPYNIALTAALWDLAYSRTDVCHATWCFDLVVSIDGYEWARGHEHPWHLMWRKHPNVEYFVCSSPMRSQLATALRTKEHVIHVLPAGVHVLRALRITDHIRFVYARRGLEDNFPLVFVPAKMSRRKGLDRALDVVEQLKLERPRSHLVIAGSPSPHDEATNEYGNSLARAIHQRHLEEVVTVLSWHQPNDHGRVSFADSLSMMALSDAVLMTSHRETFIIPILEAALSRVPIFVPATQEVAAWAGPFAIMYDPPATAAEIAHSIQQHLDETNAIRHLHIRQRYSWSAALKTIVSHFPATMAAR